eukprot:7297092-Prorocentrum_lima.AAC.1
MTSSLVGSEMCIRDSKWKSHGYKLHIGDQPVSLPESHVGEMLGDFPVSYTHLTLPTICSV